MNRRVLLLGPWAIKLPRVANGARYFLRGCLCNLNEAERYRRWVSAGPWPTRRGLLGRVWWCAPGGLLLVMQRYGPLLGRRMTVEEEASFPLLNVDNHGENVGKTPAGLVLLDYGDDPCDLVIPFYKELQ